MFPPHVKEIAVLFYTKPDCPLCDRAYELLEIVASSRDIRIESVNILTDASTYALYRDRIPVLVFPDGTVLEPPIHREELTRILNRLAEGQ